MADGVTSNLGLIKPEYDGSTDTWGPKLNGNADIIDAAIQNLRNRGSYQSAEMATWFSAPTDTVLNSNVWAQYPIGGKVYDPQNIISLGSNQFTPLVNVGIEWDVAFVVVQDNNAAYYSVHQQIFADFRLWSISDGGTVARSIRGSHSHTYSSAKYPNTSGATNSGMQGSAVVHCVGGARLTKDKVYKFEYYHRRPGDSTKWYLKFVDNTAGTGEELMFRVKVWNLG